MTLSDRIEDYCFIDTETKALPHTLGTTDADVTTAGTTRYSKNAIPIIITYAVGDALVNALKFSDFDPTRRFIWGTMPRDLLAFHERALRGEAWYVAWHMRFDRLMLNTIHGCNIRVDMVIDAMAQAAASNLPLKLEGASRSIGRHGKNKSGKQGITLFTGADWSTVTPQTHPEEWKNFWTYGMDDIVELREVFRATRPLPRKEWEEYWTSERINDRGMAVDVAFCQRAAAIAELNRRKTGARLSELTGKTITAATQALRIAQWLYDKLPETEARNELVKSWVDEDEQDSEVGSVQVPDKLSVAEDRLEAILAWFDEYEERMGGLSDAEFQLLEIIELRQFGASSTPLKFKKIVDQHWNGVLYDQYTFNGAQQTGRFSSRGVQVHNLVRKSLNKREAEAIELINSLELPSWISSPSPPASSSSEPQLVGSSDS